MDEPVCPCCPDALTRIAELEARVAELTRNLEEAMHAAKRQAVPFRKEPPSPAPKTPGRKSGDAHGTHEHRAPARFGHRVPPSPAARRVPVLPRPAGRDGYGRTIQHRDPATATGPRVRRPPGPVYRLRRARSRVATSSTPHSAPRAIVDSKAHLATCGPNKYRKPTSE